MTTGSSNMTSEHTPDAGAHNGTTANGTTSRGEASAPVGVTAERRGEILALNRRRGLLLLGSFTGILLIVGAALTPLLGGWTLIAALALAAAGVLAGVWFGSRIALATAGARPAPEADFPRYHNLAAGLAADAGLPTPTLMVIDDDALSALAVTRGRRATIAVTTGLLTSVNLLELEGVLAHELAVVASRAARVRTTAVVVGGLAALCWYRRGPGAQALWVVPAILSWPLAPLVRLVNAGRGQVEADELGAYLTRYPPGLASALDKMGASVARLPTPCRGIGHLWIVPPHSVPGPRWLASDSAAGQLEVAKRVGLLRDL